MKQVKQQDPIEKRVPKANFVQNVPDACKKEGAQNILAILDQQHNKYKLIESQLQRSLFTTNSKIPQIQKTLQMIDSLKIQNNPQVDFMLSDGVFVKAKAKKGAQKVALWLGANTIVQLSHKQAQKLLQQNLKNAHTSSKQINQQLEYIRDQRTTTEVNIARVYNHSLVQKRQQQMKAAEKAKQEQDD